MHYTYERPDRCAREWGKVWLEARKAGADPWRWLIDRELIPPFGPYVHPGRMAPVGTIDAAAPKTTRPGQP